MENKIIINGDQGAGKTKVAQLLAKMLNYEVLSTGNYFRDESEKRGMDFKSFHILMEEDPSIEKEIDFKIKELLINNTNYVIDSRMGAFFEPNAFKVYLTVDEKVGAKRMFEDAKNNPKRTVERVSTLEEMFKINKHRAESNYQRYLALYNFEHNNTDHYDLVFDTTDCLAEEVANLIFIKFDGAHKIKPASSVTK